MELRTKPIQQQEDRILTRLALAEDSANIAQQARAELDILDFYSRAGCMSPDAALLAALLIDPRALDEVRKILPDGAAFENSADRRLYDALLCTPPAALATWWPLLAKVAGMTLEQVLAYMNYDFSSCAHVKLYAAQLLNRWAYNVALNTAQRIVTDFVDGQTMRALGDAEQTFGTLRATLDAARPLINGPRKWSPNFGATR